MSKFSVDEIKPTAISKGVVLSYSKKPVGPEYGPALSLVLADRKSDYNYHEIMYSL